MEQIFWFRGYAGPSQIVRRPADEPLIGMQLGHDNIGLRDRTDAYRDVHTVSRQIHHRIGKVKRQLDARVGLQKSRRV